MRVVALAIGLSALASPTRAADTSRPPAPVPPAVISVPESPSTPSVIAPSPLPSAADKASTLLAGANSFTEAQARSRIEAMGFANVSGLKKDDQSIWRGRATKDGQERDVALDYKGNVVSQ